MHGWQMLVWRRQTCESGLVVVQSHKVRGNTAVAPRPPREHYCAAHLLFCCTLDIGQEWQGPLKCDKVNLALPLQTLTMSVVGPEQLL
jgi:hypothetical protein